MKNSTRYGGGRLRAVIVMALLCAGVSYAIAEGWVRGEEEMPQIVGKRVYRRVGVWLQSSECSAQTGSFLTVCEQGRLFPVEDWSGANDHGHTLMANAWGMITSRGITRAELVRLNWAINLGGLLALAVVLYASGLRVAAFICVALLWIYGVPGRAASADVPAAFVGILCLSLIPAFAFLLMSMGRPRTLLPRGVVVLASAACFWAAFTLRGALALIGLILVLTVAGITTIQRRGLRPAGWAGVCLLVLVCAAPAVPHAFFRAREILFHVPPGRVISGHGFSHVLFIGLGAHKNPWGIQYDDLSGKDAAERVDPTVQYCSPRYYRILRDEYLRILWSAPATVLGLYRLKYGDIMRLRVGPVAYGWTPWLILAAIGLWVLSHRLRQTVDVGPFGILAAAWFGVILQGILSAPFWQFVYPAEVLQILLGAAWLDGALALLPSRRGREEIATIEASAMGRERA